MTSKRTYTTPLSHIIRLTTDGDLAQQQFPVNSHHSISEGDAKQGDFFDEEDETQFEERPWSEVSY